MKEKVFKKCPKCGDAFHIVRQKCVNPKCKNNKENEENGNTKI